MKRKMLLGLLGLAMLAMVGFACGGDEPAAPAAAPAPQAEEAAAAPAPPPPAEEEDLPPIKIGMIAWLEGVAKDLGTLLFNGYDLGIQEWNDKGGVLGREIVGLKADEGFTGDTVVASTKKLIADGVVGIIGGTDATTCVPMKDVAKEKLLPLVVTTCGSEKITLEGYKGVAHIRAPVAEEQSPNNALSTLAKWMLSKGYKNIQGVGVDSQFVRNTNREFQRVFDAQAPADFNYNGMIYFPYGTAEARIEVTKALGSDPDMLYMGIWGKDVIVQAVSVARELGYEGDMMINEVVLGMPEVIALGAEAAEGLYTSTGWSVDPAIPASVAFRDRYFAMHESEPDWFSEIGYTGAHLLLGAINDAGTTDSAAVRDNLLAVDFDTPRGDKIKFTETGQRIVPKWAIVQVRDGALVVENWFPIQDE